MNALSAPEQSLNYAAFDDLKDAVAEQIKPPRRMKINEAAQEYLQIQLPNGGYGPWDADLTPYLLEPMNCLNDRRYESVVLIGPARSGKTIVILAWLSYVIAVDPGDMMIIHTEKDQARHLSKVEVDRSIQKSPALLERLSTRASDDNTFDKFFKAGNMLTLAWPTIRQLSSRTIKYLAATDYDRRLNDDVNGEGDLFGLMNKRKETFMSSGKSFVETSPGFPVMDPQWRPSTAHEAPPCDGGGALSFYNAGDRRRRYWQCLKCKEWFIADFEHLTFTPNEDDEIAAASAKMECPHCHYKIPPRHRRKLEAKGKWLKEGQTITPDGETHGEARESKIASFWFQGPSACFQTWQSQILSLLRAEREYELNGSEEQLKRTVTQDQGKPYIPKAREKDRSYVDLMDRAEDLGRQVVPLGVRFIFASVDVQKGEFIVQVEGYGMGLEHWYIDRYKISKSPARLDEDGDPMPLRPGAYDEDWDALIHQVMNKTYPLGDDSGREMRIRWMACDSGGRAGVTLRAYKFYRRLRSRGLTNNFMLVKGDQGGPRIRKTFPDSQRKDRKAGARGEIPLQLLNVNLIKDSIDSSLTRTDPGPGCSHFPDWFPDWWYKEMVAEIKNGERWDKIPGRRNEALDLTVYNRGCLMASKGEEIDWMNPPGWADEWDKNILVFHSRKPDDTTEGDDPEFSLDSDDVEDIFSELGRELG